ncbi:ATPase family_ AAA domain containing 2B (Silurana), partial [Caligus rogercresseyi]
WVGESGRQLRLLFQEAHACRPAIIFFDEFDALAPIRSKHQDQIYCSVVATLLALMDGFEQREQVLVIGATNRIESIDPAFRRPGRFDKELKFELPSESIRKEIIKMHVQKWNLRALIGDAALRALKRTFPGVYQSTSQKINIDTGKIRITENDFTQSMKAMTPSTHRVRKELRMPLPPHIRPLLKADLLEISEKINSIFPMNSYRPRLVVCAKNALYGQTSYLAPAVLYHLENIPIHRFDSESLFSNTRGAIMEETGLNLLKESIKCLPS